MCARGASPAGKFPEALGSPPPSGAEGCEDPVPSEGIGGTGGRFEAGGLQHQVASTHLHPHISRTLRLVSPIPATL